MPCSILLLRILIGILSNRTIEQRKYLERIFFLLLLFVLSVRLFDLKISRLVSGSKVSNMACPIRSLIEFLGVQQFSAMPKSAENTGKNVDCRGVLHICPKESRKRLTPIRLASLLEKLTHQRCAISFFSRSFHAPQAPCKKLPRFYVGSVLISAHLDNFDGTNRSSAAPSDPKPPTWPRPG